MILKRDYTITYYCNKEKSFDFETAYVDFFECIGILIKELIK